MGKAIRHIRRPRPQPTRRRWRLDCDCGWRAEIPAFNGPRAIGRREADAELERLFIEHIPPPLRQTYVLVDQREAEIEENGECAVVGNFIMPEGKPCRILRWWEDGGLYRGRVRGFALEDPELELPIGEIRTRQGRVFRLA